MLLFSPLDPPEVKINGGLIQRFISRASMVCTFGPQKVWHPLKGAAVVKDIPTPVNSVKMNRTGHTITIETCIHLPLI